MSDQVATSIGARPYWGTIKDPTPVTSVGVPPNFGTGKAVGKLPGVLVDIVRWFVKNNFTDKMIDATVAGQLADVAGSAIQTSGLRGYLFEVSVLSNPSGGLRSLHPLPVPLAPGDSIDDALARHINSGPFLKATPPDGWLYSNENSFFIWVTEDGAGGLDAKINIRPLMAYKRVRRVLYAGLSEELDAIAAVEERGRVYKELTDKAIEKIRERRLWMSLKSLENARAHASELYKRAYQNRLAAARAREDAANFQKMANILGAIGAVGNATTKLAGDGAKQSSLNATAASKALDIRVEIIQRIEVELNNTIKLANPGSPVPNKFTPLP